MKKQSHELKAPVAEIFFSYQGEGLYVGQPQVFVRFAGCNLRCCYCDTPATQSLSEHQQFISSPSIIERIKRSAQKAPGKVKTTVSLTGGEPLLYATFMQDLLPRLKKAGMKVYLETNGTLPEALKKVLRWVDVVSMDIKLPSAAQAELWAEHGEFLRIARCKAFVKVVLTGKTSEGEIRKAIGLIEKISPDIPLVFQPVTPSPRCSAVHPLKIYLWTQAARTRLKNVHVQPQMHPLWGVR
jgi:organic radical activating enzyme